MSNSFCLSQVQTSCGGFIMGTERLRNSTRCGIVLCNKNVDLCNQHEADEGCAPTTVDGNAGLLCATPSTQRP
jgi:hypothetical protein